MKKKCGSEQIKRKTASYSVVHETRRQSTLLFNFSLKSELYETPEFHYCLYPCEWLWRFYEFGIIDWFQWVHRVLNAETMKNEALVYICVTWFSVYQIWVIQIEFVLSTLHTPRGKLLWKSDWLQEISFFLVFPVLVCLHPPFGGGLQ